MPGSLVELAGTPRDGNGDGTGDEVRGTSQDEGEGCVEVQALRRDVSSSDEFRDMI